MEDYESLRKEARKLESIIDAKLVDYAKLLGSANVSVTTRASSFDNLRVGVSDGTNHNHNHAPPLLSSSLPALRARANASLTYVDYTTATATNSAALQRRPAAVPRESSLSAALSAAEASTAELEALLARLTSVVDALAAGENSSQPSSTQAHRAHTVQRHSEILHDYNKEFRKTRKTVASLRDSAELFSGATLPRQSPPQAAMSAADALHSERIALAGASSAAESATGAGLSLKEDLERQRAMFASMVERMETMSEGIPAVNRLIGQIRRKKKRDVLILSAAIAVLLFATFSWKMSR